MMSDDMQKASRAFGSDGARDIEAMHDILRDNNFSNIRFNGVTRSFTILHSESAFLQNIQNIMINNQYRFRAWFPQVSRPNERGNLEITLTGLASNIGRGVNSDED